MNKEKKRFLTKYSIIFLFLSLIIIYFYYSQSKSLINYGGDGFRQYFRALIYIRDHFLTVLNNIFVNHSFVIPQWDFAIGEGSDILETFHYYGLGDPINLLSVFVKEEHLSFFYDFSIFLRMYLSGITFAQFCFYKKENIDATLLGSILYSFCSFALASAYGHILFLNALIYLPLVILGVEKIINNDGWKTLTTSVFLSSISSIYFFYMIVLITIIYTIVRVFYINKSFKDIISLLIRITIYSFLGVLISGIIFVPSFYSLINNSRLSEIKHSLLYEPSYYLNLLTDYVYSFSYFGGYTVLGLFAAVSLFSNRKNNILKVLFIIGIVFCCIPFFGKLFNAMTYVTDRWLFAMDFLICYIIVHTFEDFINDRKILKYLLITVPYFVFCSIYKISDRKTYLLFMALGLLILFLKNKVNNKNLSYITLLFTATFSLMVCIFFVFSPLYWNYSSRGTDFSVLENMKNEEHSVFDNLNDETFYRYSGNSITTNQGCLGDKSSTSYYWSVSNSNVIEFRTELGLSDRNNHHYDNYNESYILNSLSCVKYYIDKNENTIPYGFVFDDNINNYNIYKSDSNLPLIYGYDSYIKEEDFKKYNEVQKQEILTYLAVLENSEHLEEASIKLNNEIIDYKLESNKVNIENNIIYSLEEDAYLKIRVDSNKIGEYYLLVEGLESNESFDLPVEIKDVNTKNIVYKCETEAGYSNRHDFSINLGYHDGLSDEIYIYIPNNLKLKIDSINIACLPLKESKANLEKLNCVDINDLIIKDNTIDTNIKIKEDKYLCFAIPCHDGWKLKVDGKETNLEKCNLMYMGSFVKKGEHNIELTYESPMLKVGTFITIFGTLVFIFFCIKDKSTNIRKSNKKEEHII